jgi:hypothetical protein
MNTDKTILCDRKGIRIVHQDINKAPYRYFYESSLRDELQFFGRSLPKKQEKFTKAQNRILNEALHGLDYYSDNIKNKMSFKQKLSIESLHSRTTRYMNVWKHSIIVNEVDSILMKIFPNSKWINNLVNETKNFTNEDLIEITNMRSEVKFSELGIDRVKIAEELFRAKILPITFYDKKLKTA